MTIIIANNINKPKVKDLSPGEKLRYGYNPMTECVRWTEQFSPHIEKLCNQLPNWLAQLLIFASLLLLASGIQGDWIVILVHLYKYIKLQDVKVTNNTLEEPIDSSTDNNGSLLFFICAALTGSYVIYFSMGGVLHWYFYVRQRNKSHEWKIQPEKFLTPELEREEILLGSLTIFILSIVTGVIAWYAANDGQYLTVYYRADEFGWLWFFLQVPIIFIYQDYYAYWIHRIFHTPFLYKRFHKMHHKFKQPTIFSATAVHPVELGIVQLGLLLPIVLIPVHWILFYGFAMYLYYHGLIDHSGIAFKAQWWQPWQSDAVFHDSHHQYTHVNYGLNMTIWDRLHGTYRVTRDDIFNGNGKAQET